MLSLDVGIRVMKFVKDVQTVIDYGFKQLMYICIVQYILELRGLHNLQPWYLNSLFYSLISSGVNSAFAHFAVAIANHCNVAFFVPPGAH